MAGAKGRSGRKRKPDALHAMQGTARKDRHSKKNPPAAGGEAESGSAEELKAPSFVGLTRREKTVWPKVVELLNSVPGLATKIDVVAIATMCMLIVEIKDRRAEIAEHGTVCVSEKGGVYQHPAVGQLNKSRGELYRMLREFGMTPSSRSGIDVSTGSAGDLGNRFAKFLESGLN